jgi:spermidine/putrescine transport system permease protein
MLIRLFGKTLWASVVTGAIGLLYIPMLAVAILSFNTSSRTMTWQGFTLKWYDMVVKDEVIREAAWVTLKLACLSTLIATVLGTLLAIGIDRFIWPRPIRAGLEAVAGLPVVMPDILFAAALVVAMQVARVVTDAVQPGFTLMLVGHVTFQVAFVALVVRARFAMIPVELEEAARDLYGSTWTVYRRVLIPLLMPGIVAGAVLAFTLSLDDFIISFFTAGPDSQTLAILMYGALRRQVSPDIHALSTLLLVATITLVFLGQWFMQPRAANKE